MVRKNSISDNNRNFIRNFNILKNCTKTNHTPNTMSLIIENYGDASLWQWESKDPIIDTMYLMPSPIPLLLILTTYFLIIVVGTRFMKNRPAFELNNILIIYNAFQVLLSAYLSMRIVRDLKVFQDGFLLAGCRFPADSKDPELLHGTWLYFFAKITELLDTVFFVLRKKNNQVTFLHVYHHSSMVVYMWSYLKYASGGDGPVLAFFNCVIHVIMYSYYLLAGLGPRFQKYLWWKKYVTELQLIQFLTMLFYLSWTFFSPSCRFSKTFTSIIFFNISTFLVLFLQFYVKSYKRNNDKKL